MTSGEQKKGFDFLAGRTDDQISKSSQLRENTACDIVHVNLWTEIHVSYINIVYVREV